MNILFRPTHPQRNSCQQAGKRTSVPICFCLQSEASNPLADETVPNPEKLSAWMTALLLRGNFWRHVSPPCFSLTWREDWRNQAKEVIVPRHLFFQHVSFACQICQCQNISKHLHHLLSTVELARIFQEGQHSTRVCHVLDFRSDQPTRILLSNQRAKWHWGHNSSCNSAIKCDLGSKPCEPLMNYNHLQIGECGQCSYVFQ